MAPPTVRRTAQDTAATPSYSVRWGQSRPPLAGDIILMYLPAPEHPTPPGWTRLGQFVHRIARGDEHNFPGPAVWVGPTSDAGTTWP